MLQRIFETGELDDYQGRELSYAIDCLDAQWIRALLSRGVYLFIAPSVLLAALAFVPIGIWLVPYALPGLERSSRWLVLLLYLSSFAVSSTTGLLYRATKPLVAPLLLVLLLLVLAELRRPRPGNAATFFAVFATSLGMSLLDRQGLFYLLVLLPVLVLAWLWVRRGLAMLLALAAALLACYLYNDRIGPWLIHFLNGYWPDRSFQQLDPRWLLEPGPWLGAVHLLGDWTRLLVGGLPPALPLAALLTGLGAWAWHERRRPGRVAFVLAAGALAALVQTSMVAMMVARYPTITWIDHRFWYYPLPFQALLIAAALWGLDRVALAHRSLPRAVPIVLAALVLGNLAQWPERRELMQSGPWFSGVARRSALLERSWREGRADLRLDGEYRRFYFESLVLFPRLAARAGAYVAEGNGVGLTEVRNGRLLATVRREAHLPVTATKAGRYVLQGGVLLRPGTTLQIRLGLQALAEIVEDDEEPVVRRFRVTADLASGRSDFVLLARHASPASGGRRFVLRLPVLVWRDENAREDTIIF